MPPHRSRRHSRRHVTIDPHVLTTNSKLKANIKYLMVFGARPSCNVAMLVRRRFTITLCDNVARWQISLQRIYRAPSGGRSAVKSESRTILNDTLPRVIEST